MSRLIVHPAKVSRTGGSRSVRTAPVRLVTIALGSYFRYASGVQTVVTSPPPS